jgi:GT2 family glycosyltransferase
MPVRAARIRALAPTRARGNRWRRVMHAAAPAAPSLSVIVPSHNRAQSVLRLLRALRDQTGPSGLHASHLEVLVIADGCTDDTSAQLAQSERAGEWPFRLTVVAHDSPRGAAESRNAGAAMATGATLLFIDDDIEPFPTMLATHVRLHAEAGARGDSALVIGAPVPTRDDSPSLGHLAGWGWWEQQFEAMSAVGHRFTFDQVFTGLLSVSRGLFTQVGGFDRLLGDCHEDSELGLRLFRAGARAVFTREGGGAHHEVRDVQRLLPRKEAEGRADVRLLQRWPELVPALAIGGKAPRQWRFFPLVQRIGFSATLSELLPPLVLPALRVLERLRFRGHWRMLQGGLLVSRYWHGVAQECRSVHELDARVASAEASHAAFCVRATRCNVDLADGIEAAERRLDAIRPESVRVLLHGAVIGTIAPRPEAEQLHGGHLRRLLATELAAALEVALAQQDSRESAAGEVVTVGAREVLASASLPGA